ncbi:YXWGXW repeat-containing protein [Paraburkholderia dinghuensis]|uniref:YXWGXW repeat-containing protein n=1 Tax=Paraburkholderia dinghuensis TaxID=2305225 RepID=A0A3N6NCQ7_9BURK|nr:YXWGXW repeat-containing protein [Paraburkholderia dinghuensis]RQH09111.1 hypothetical protein D1Y85_04415 [Paraburkholderia dinghuensis]
MNRPPLQRVLVAAFAALATSAVLARGITLAPPPPRAEEVPQARAGYVWDPGHWNWVRGRYVWADGRWLEDRPDHHWTPGQWISEGRTWRWEPGKWD